MAFPWPIPYPDLVSDPRPDRGPISCPMQSRIPESGADSMCSESGLPTDQAELVLAEAAQVVFGEAALPEEVSEDRREDGV